MAQASGIAKRVTSHTFRHSSITHLVEDGNDTRTVQESMGLAGVPSTCVDTHVLNRPGKRGVLSAACQLQTGQITSPPKPVYGTETVRESFEPEPGKNRATYARRRSCAKIHQPRPPGILDKTRPIVRI